jgi:hypothetical protein
METWTGPGATGRADADWTGIWWIPVKVNTKSKTNTFQFETQAQAVAALDRKTASSTFAGTATGTQTVDTGFGLATCNWSFAAQQAMKSVALRIYPARKGVSLRLSVKDPVSGAAGSCDKADRTKSFIQPEAIFLNADFCAYNEADADRNADFGLFIPQKKVGKFSKSLAGNERGAACNPFASEDTGTVLTSKLSLKAQIFKRKP